MARILLGVTPKWEKQLFRHVAAVVHHGGAGTTTTAALAGVPQVVLPQMFDQHYWAERVDKLSGGTLKDRVLAEGPMAPPVAVSAVLDIITGSVPVSVEVQDQRSLRCSGGWRGCALGCPKNLLIIVACLYQRYPANYITLCRFNHMNY